MGIIRYEDIGTGRPVVLLHGYGADRRLLTGCMEPVFLARRDAPGWRRLYVDLPGMGESPAPGRIRNSDDIVAEVLEFIDETLPGSSFVLAGESYGGYLAREILRRVFRRVEGLLLVCPAVLPDKEKRELPPKKVICRSEGCVPPGRSAREVEDFSDFTVQTRETWRRYENEILCGARVADRSFLRRLRPDGYALREDPDILPEPFDEPALVLLGRQDHIVGYRDSWRIIENFPRASFMILDRAGHNLQIEQPRLFAEAVDEWLDRLVEKKNLGDPPPRR